MKRISKYRTENIFKTKSTQFHSSNLYLVFNKVLKHFSIVIDYWSHYDNENLYEKDSMIKLRVLEFGKLFIYNEYSHLNLRL